MFGGAGLSPGGVPTDFFLQVAAGRVPGMSSVNVYGLNSDVGTATDPEDVWSGGGIWVPPTTARIHDIASSSANDTNSSGSGARTLRIWGLDSNFLEVTEDINLAGASNVATSNSYTRINHMLVLTAGSSEANEGAITATAQTDGTVTAHIPADEGAALSSIYSVQDGKTAYMQHLYVGMFRGASAGAGSIIHLHERTGIDTSTPAFRNRFALGVDVTGTSFVDQPLSPPKVFVGPCDILLRCESVTDNNTSVIGGYDLIILDTA